MTGIDGQHALVTGGGRGIGAAIAKALTAAGALVTVTGRQEAPLSQLVASGAAASYQIADVTNADAVRHAVKQAVDQRGPVEILVANAGAAESAPFLRTEPAAFQRMFDVNLMGVVHTVQAVLEPMREARSGRIIAIASTAGLTGYRYTTAYSAAKHAVIGLVRSLALETARRGVTVNAVCPGYTDTDLVSTAVENIVKKTGMTAEQATAELVRDNPQGRLITPSQVADTVVWLCGPGAAAITGQAIAVAGGEVM